MLRTLHSVGGHLLSKGIMVGARPPNPGPGLGSEDPPPNPPATDLMVRTDATPVTDPTKVPPHTPTPTAGTMARASTEAVSVSDGPKP